MRPCDRAISRIRSSETSRGSMLEMRNRQAGWPTSWISAVSASRRSSNASRRSQPFSPCSRQEPRLMPVSTISRTPSRARATHSETIAWAGRLEARPRATWTMQYVQALLHPSCTFTPTRVLKPSPTASGTAPWPMGPTSRSSTSSTCSLPAICTRSGSMDVNASASMAAAQPVTTTSDAGLARKTCLTAFRVFFSASPVTVHVLTTTTSAASGPVSKPPRASKPEANESDSTRLTLHPRFTIAKFMRAHLPPSRPFRTAPTRALRYPPFQCAEWRTRATPCARLRCTR